MAFSLATNPEVRKKAKAEIAANLGSGTPTFADMKALPYTYAVLKEALRYATLLTPESSDQMVVISNFLC